MITAKEARKIAEKVTSNKNTEETKKIIKVLDDAIQERVKKGCHFVNVGITWDSETYYEIEKTLIDAGYSLSKTLYELTIVW